MSNHNISGELTPANTGRRAYSLNEVAGQLHVSRQTLYNLRDRGELHISKILGKSVVFAEDLEACIRRSRGGGAA